MRRLDVLFDLLATFVLVVLHVIADETCKFYICYSFLKKYSVASSISLFGSVFRKLFNYLNSTYFVIIFF